eukprot:scaffold384543_cov169-Cyclotella_meneghiniana.AAC.2
MGTRPNDYFSVLSLPPSTPAYQRAAVAAAEEDRKILITSYGGDARMVTCHKEIEIGRGVGATFLACLYVRADATTPKRGLLRQYLEAVWKCRSRN